MDVNICLANILGQTSIISMAAASNGVPCSKWVITWLKPSSALFKKFNSAEGLT
jgi:hypothetical protein